MLPYSQGFHVAELPCYAEGSLLKKYRWGNCFFLRRYHVHLIYLISIALFCINLNLAAALVLKKSVSQSRQNLWELKLIQDWTAWGDPRDTRWQSCHRCSQQQCLLLLLPPRPCASVMKCVQKRAWLGGTRLTPSARLHEAALKLLLLPWVCLQPALQHPSLSWQERQETQLIAEGRRIPRVVLHPRAEPYELPT